MGCLGKIFYGEKVMKLSVFGLYECGLVDDFLKSGKH